MKFKRKENPHTIAQLLFKDKQLINERPEGMTYQEYRIMRSHQTKLLGVLLAKEPNGKILLSMGVRRGYNQHR